MIYGTSTLPVCNLRTEGWHGHVRTYRNLAASSNLNPLYVKAQIGTDFGYELAHTESQVWNLEEASEP